MVVMFNQRLLIVAKVHNFLQFSTLLVLIMTDKISKIVSNFNTFW